MAENSGHLAIVESSPDDSVWTEIDGVRAFDVNRSADALETTNFKDASGAKPRIIGLRSGDAAITGDLTCRASTFEIDEGIKTLLRRVRDGGAVHLRTKLDGAAGAYRGAECLCEEFTLSADVGGLVEFSAKTCLNGEGWA